MDVLSPADEREYNKWLNSTETINRDNAAKALRETKQIFDSLGVRFFLRQGTCLGAIRDKGLLPWDDDVDVGSVIGLHGFTEESIEQIMTVFRNNGFLANMDCLGGNPYVLLAKYNTRCDWMCFRIIDDYIVQFPYLKTPLKLFSDLKEISFLNDRYYVPNPPQEYLRLKYGDDWQTPKKPGDFEEDVLTQVAMMPAPQTDRLRSFISRFNPWMGTSTVRVLDNGGVPVKGAEVIAVGLGSFQTDKMGCARFYVPRDDFYPLVIRYRDYERINYLQRIVPGEEYVFKADG